MKRKSSHHHLVNGQRVKRSKFNLTTTIERVFEGYGDDDHHWNDSKEHSTVDEFEPNRVDSNAMFDLNLLERIELSNTLNHFVSLNLARVLYCSVKGEKVNYLLRARSLTAATRLLEAKTQFLHRKCRKLETNLTFMSRHSTAGANVSKCFPLKASPKSRPIVLEHSLSRLLNNNSNQNTSRFVHFPNCLQVPFEFSIFKQPINWNQLFTLNTDFEGRLVSQDQLLLLENSNILIRDPTVASNSEDFYSKAITSNSEDFRSRNIDSIALRSMEIDSNSIENTSNSTEILSESIEITSSMMEIDSNSFEFTSNSMKIDSNSIENTSNSTEILSESIEITSSMMEIDSNSFEFTSNSMKIDSNPIQINSDSMSNPTHPEEVDKTFEFQAITDAFESPQSLNSNSSKSRSNKKTQSTRTFRTSSTPNKTKVIIIEPDIEAYLLDGNALEFERFESNDYFQEVKNADPNIAGFEMESFDLTSEFDSSYNNSFESNPTTFEIEPSQPESGYSDGGFYSNSESDHGTFEPSVQARIAPLSPCFAPLRFEVTTLKQLRTELFKAIAARSSNGFVDFSTILAHFSNIIASERILVTPSFLFTQLLQLANEKNLEFIPFETSLDNFIIIISVDENITSVKQAIIRTRALRLCTFSPSSSPPRVHINSLIRVVAAQQLTSGCLGLPSIEATARRHISTHCSVLRLSASHTSPTATAQVKPENNNKDNKMAATYQQPSSEYIYTNDTPVVPLDSTSAFENLTYGEQVYAHYLSKASWFGSLIVLYQTSPESPLIFTLFRRLFTLQSMDELKSLAMDVAKMTDDEWRALLVYVGAFYSNMGNYRGFGDSKFIPNLPREKLEQLVLASAAYQQNASLMEFVWDHVKDRMFSLEPNELSLGFKPKGQTTYWSKNMTEEDEPILKKFLAANNLDAYNSRALKDPSTGEYIIRFASTRTDADPEERDYMNKFKVLELDGHRVRFERGDYSPILALVNEYLGEARKSACNPTEAAMIGEYIRHFRSGDLDGHKEGSRHWIKDKGPIVETYIGFIENYRDPAGQRAEFEGFVAMVNKEMTKKFSRLVAGAASLLPKLPWPQEFEKDHFLQPDFTSLDVLTFTGSGIPAGINIPNYDEIRQNEGFKNVSLGNVITASLKESTPNFLNENDATLLNKYNVPAFEVVVGLHELLGHGSGKLFKADTNGTLNFDPAKVINPLTGKPVDRWYQPSQSYDSQFAGISSAYEECRAECVGLYLSLDSTVLEIFGFAQPEEARNVVYACWLSMVHKGIESLKMYNSQVKKWLQAHSQARYVITRVLLEGAPDLVKLEYIERSEKDGKPDLLLHFNQDPSVIHTQGKKAIGDFLQKLQVYKTTGDVEAASRMFNHYSAVEDHLEYPYLKFRDITLARKKPRKLFVEAASTVDAASVRLKSFEPSHEGLIQAFQEHFNGVENLDQILVDLWQKDAVYFA